MSECDRIPTGPISSIKGGKFPGDDLLVNYTNWSEVLLCDSNQIQIKIKYCENYIYNYIFE